jgi:hypothetical protein
VGFLIKKETHEAGMKLNGGFEMKKLFSLMIFTILSLVLSSSAYAGLKTIGSGNAMRLDPSGFPPDMRERYEKVMQVRCIKCHTLERAIIALKTGVAPITGQPFDRNATKAYGIKMMRKPDSNMTREEVKEVVILLNYLLDEAAR